MTRAVVTRACANIALIKYWGKRDDTLNLPATPSISLALDCLTTTTHVERFPGSATPGSPVEVDLVQLNGEPAPEADARRVRSYLDIWRELGLIEGVFSISSRNDFPTGAGLASSSSGFAALAVALAEFATIRLSPLEISRLARQGSGSAARSIPGGLAAMPNGKNAAARRLAAPEDIDWGMVVAIVEATPKEIGSGSGMNLSRDTSPFYRAWLRTARHDYQAMLRHVKSGDFTAIGELAEADSYAMHACMFATRPALLYWNDATMRLLRQVREWRRAGLECYATVDAGPHVCLIARRTDLNMLRDEAAAVPGVRTATIGLPGPAASIIEHLE